MGSWGHCTKLFTKKWAKIGPFWAEWAIQDLIINHWVKLRVSSKKFDFQPNMANFCSFFCTVTPTSHQSFRINTFAESCSRLKTLNNWTSRTAFINIYFSKTPQLCIHRSIEVKRDDFDLVTVLLHVIECDEIERDSRGEHPNLWH